MVKKRPKLSEHACPHCGTLYTVALNPEESATDYHNAICTMCGDVMAEWHTKETRQYSRVTKELRRDPNQLARTIVGIAASSRVKDRATKQGRDPAALALGQRGGLKGRKARAAKKSQENK